VEITSPSFSPLLEFQNVSKTFVSTKSHRFQALLNIDFYLEKGEFVVILGPSGCGKSTILRLAAGLDYPTTGQIIYQGKLIQKPDRQRGFVFQSYSVFPWLTVQENIEFGIEKADPQVRQSRVSSLLAFTGLTDFANVYPKTLSGGMRQRLALARTMITEPELLLLDEPFGALDERTRESMQTLLLNAVAKSKCSTLFVTHDIREALILADRIFLISSRPGHISNIFVPPTGKPRTRETLSEQSLQSLYEQILDSFPLQAYN
jgi:NitT/TauT family transport system ATP-binding protein